MKKLYGIVAKSKESDKELTFFYEADNEEDARIQHTKDIVRGAKTDIIEVHEMTGSSCYIFNENIFGKIEAPDIVRYRYNKDDRGKIYFILEDSFKTIRIQSGFFSIIERINLDSEDHLYSYMPRLDLKYTFKHYTII